MQRVASFPPFPASGEGRFAGPLLAAGETRRVLHVATAIDRNLRIRAQRPRARGRPARRHVGVDAARHCPRRARWRSRCSGAWPCSTQSHQRRQHVELVGRRAAAAVVHAGHREEAGEVGGVAAVRRRAAPRTRPSCRRSRRSGRWCRGTRSSWRRGCLQGRQVARVRRRHERHARSRCRSRWSRGSAPAGVDVGRQREAPGR